MASYKAEIDIVAKGLGRINKLNDAVSKLNKNVQALNGKTVGTGGASPRASSEQNVLKTLKLQTQELQKQLKLGSQIVDRPQQARGAGTGGGRGRGRGRGGKFQDIATGAGFPLLFGGGPLQALAGGIGGAAGGLGGSIAASAITAQAEAFAKDTAAVGQALNSTSGALELMREKSLFSKDATKELAAELEGLGEIEKLSTLLTKELVQKIGNEGVTALQDLGTESDKTTRLWSALTLQLQALLAGPLKDFLALINSVLGAATTSGQFKVLESELTGQARTDFDTDVASRRAANLAATASGATGASGMMSSMGTAGGVGVLSPADQRELVEKYLPKLQVTADIPDLGGIKLPKTKKGPKGRESRLPQLQAEVNLQERLAVLSRQATKAKEEENPIREAALNMEIALEKQATAIEKINLEKITAAEKLEKTKLVELATDEKVFAIKNKLKAAEASRAEKASETIGGLQKQKDLLEARLNGTEKEVAFKQELEKLTKDMTPEEAARTEELLRGVAATEEQVKALEKLESMYASIGQSISSGIVDALSAAVEGTKSLADVASQTLRQVANILLQFGINTALGGIPGLSSFFPGRATGGPVSGGSPYMVGEKGPELFVPNTSGNIVPNNKLGGGGGGSTNVVVNVDAKGSSASGDSGAGKQLGGLIGAAVQAELIKQQRPGGLLSS